MICTKVTTIKLAVLLLSVSLATLVVNGQVPNSLEPAGQQLQQDTKAGVWPMVDVDRSNNKSTVDVHVPIFFDMTNHNDPLGGKSKLDLSVLQGLVTVTKDKQRDQSGSMVGPTRVTVFGIPVYQGRSPLPQQAPSTNSDGLGSEQLSALSTRVQQTRENVMSSLSDMLGRLTSFVRQPQQQQQQSAADLTSNLVDTRAGQAASQFVKPAVGPLA